MRLVVKEFLEALTLNILPKKLNVYKQMHYLREHSDRVPKPQKPLFNVALFAYKQIIWLDCGCYHMVLGHYFYVSLWNPPTWFHFQIFKPSSDKKQYCFKQCPKHNTDSERTCSVKFPPIRLYRRVIASWSHGRENTRFWLAGKVLELWDCW